MHFAKGIHHLLGGALACLLMIGLSATYWAIAGGRSLLLRDDNPRKFLALAAVQRGGIYDRNGQLLADTIAGTASFERHYPRPSVFSAVGYYSLRFGLSGLEAAYDDLLSGRRELTSLGDYIERDLLRIQQIGSDIRLSIDAELQDALLAAMGDARGAAVVLNARTGAVLALVSLPSFNPNTLDDDWEELVAADGQPFFNRALQSNYQLGGTIYTVLLAEAITSQFDLTQPFPQAAEAVEFEDGMTIACVAEPEATEFTLIDAYAYGCPAPFQAYFLAEPQPDLDGALRRFAFDNPVALSGLPQPIPIEPPVAPASEQFTEQTLELRAALGQGNLTTTPLHMAAIMAALASDGTIKMPTIHAATRPSGEGPWRETSASSSSIPVISAAVANEMRAIMRGAWSVLQNDKGGGDIGAQVAMSQSGDDLQIWLNGFSVNADGAAYSFAIILENSDDLSRLLSIGQRLIDALDML